MHNNDWSVSWHLVTVFSLFEDAVCMVQPHVCTIVSNYFGSFCVSLVVLLFMLIFASLYIMVDFSFSSYFFVVCCYFASFIVFEHFASLYSLPLFYLVFLFVLILLCIVCLFCVI